MNEPAKTKRPYRKITPQTVARFKSERIIQGNGTAAVRTLEPDLEAASDRAYKLAKKSELVSPTDYVEQSMERISVEAIDRVGSIVNSQDERSALKASIFVIEQRRGKAVQKTENKNYSLNIQAVLE